MKSFLVWLCVTVFLISFGLSFVGQSFPLWIRALTACTLVGIAVSLLITGKKRGLLN